MAGYILDTSVLSVHLDPMHRRHREFSAEIRQLEQTGTLYISPVVLAELAYGVEMAQAFGNARLPALRAMLAQARAHGALVPVTHHTAAAYAELKTRLATAYLQRAMRRDRPRWIEDWIDRATGQRLQVDENDLWICAQAKERALTVVAADGGMRRIADADAEVDLVIL